MKRLMTSVNVQINSEGDSIKNVFVTRLITGEYHIVYKNNGTPTTVIKPYTESTRRKIIFKRVARTNRPMMNWRLYKIGLLDGNTETPQKGTDLVEMNKLEVYVNNVLTYTFNGPDFTSTLFTTRRFDGEGIPEAEIGDEVKIKVYTFSKEIEPDIVAWHWARNVFGFHRVPFEMTHNDPVQGGFNRIYEKTWTIYTGHVHGAHNGYISASTHKSLYDDSLNQFASDLFGIPYRIKP